MRQIKINKYKGNTHYNVEVVDSYGTEHHLGYYKHIYTNKLEEKAQEIWANEVKPKVDLMAEAIKECIEIDKENNIEPNLD
tara:strand:+ start:426 stop:668 length:243 start_codon:yes stop_codon:yes gene_type:complete